MKKTILFSLALSCLIPLTSFANGKNCLYHPLQDIIRSARSAQDIEKLINDKINFNIDFRCGGTVLQLAILRGNPEVLQVLLEKAGLDPNETVGNSIYPIKGAPKTYPIAFFAAYYAPRPDILSLLISSGASVYQKDANGQNILWYIEQNSVLRNTELSDQIVKNLLISDTNEQNKKEELERKKQEEVLQKLEKAKLQVKKAQKNVTEPAVKPEKKEPQKKEIPQTPTSEPEQKPVQTMIETEPDQTFQPPKEDEEQIDLQQSDF